MRNIVGAFGTLMVLAIYFFACIAVSNACIAVAEAKEFKAEVVAEIENSNFNPNVIGGCGYGTGCRFAGTAQNAVYYR